LRVRTTDGSNESGGYVRSTNCGARNGDRGGSASVRERLVDLETSNASKLANSSQESSDRDHSVDRRHVLSPRQLYDGELEPSAHEGHQSESAHGRFGRDSKQARLHQPLGG